MNIVMAIVKDSIGSSLEAVSGRWTHLMRRDTTLSRDSRVGRSMVCAVEMQAVFLKGDAEVKSARGAAPYRFAWRAAALVMAAAFVATLGGCASVSVGSLLSKKETATKTTALPIAVAPIIGAPATVSKALSRELASAAARRSIPVVSGQNAAAAYTLRGYLATSPEAGGQKLAYIWDVTDASGKRVHRILGQEPIKAASPQSPWAGVDAKVLQKIATKTTADLAAWMPGGTTGSVPKAVAAAPARPSAAEKKAPIRTAARANAPVGDPGDFFARVPNVTGAPGDGKKALTLAIKKQLFKRGLKLTSNRGTNVYTVRGSVKMGSLQNDTQSISIDWQVLDPKGKSLGTVSQKNTIPKGSLDKTWGNTADAAAAAASDGIVKLLPKPKN